MYTPTIPELTAFLTGRLLKFYSDLTLGSGVADEITLQVEPRRRPLVRFPAQPDGLLVVYQCTHTLWPHPPPLFPVVYQCNHNTRRILLRRRHVITSVPDPELSWVFWGSGVCPSAQEAWVDEHFESQTLRLSGATASGTPVPINFIGRVENLEHDWQGLTLVNFSAQPEPFLKLTFPKTPKHPFRPPRLKYPLNTPCPTKALTLS